ncbi:hypothetical protein C2S51_029845 [Perilla frutescens var. frutescens]|nr:hypothetical protein C2S51_029845 [Perilla frutescens var. frutescens]
MSNKGAGTKDKAAGMSEETLTTFDPKNIVEAIQQHLTKLFKTEMATLNERLNKVETSLQEQSQQAPQENHGGKGGRCGRGA